MTVQQAYQQLTAQLRSLYDKRETAAMANLVIEHITGFGNSSRIVHKTLVLSDEQHHLFLHLSAQLSVGKPLQYALHEASFYGMKLYVDERVLIPRPETEELVEWVSREINTPYSLFTIQYSILDIGTGSGCIPVALKKQFPHAAVHAIDISAGALEVAKRNAVAQHTTLHLHQADILDKNNRQGFQQFNCIVSNPPYITLKEAADMHNNVLQHEPHTALFVPDENPLLFYEAIALFGLQHLHKEGQLFLEINERYGKEIRELLAANGYTDIELRKDMQGKDRMVRAHLLR